MDETERTEANLSVRGIGGIDTCEVSFEPGVTVLSGSNATNRTSLLTAIAGVLGGSAATLKGGYEEGRVALELDGDTYTRSYERRNGEVIVDGDPYTDEANLIDLFSALLEDNPVRRAVERGDDLADVLMRPVDTERIERRIEEHRRERDRIDDRIDEIDRERQRLPGLEDRRQELRADLEEVEAEIEEIRGAIDEYDRGADAIEAAEEAMDELETLREELEETNRSIETQRSSIDALREEREEVEDELASISLPADDPEDIEERRAELKERERSLSNTIDTLSGILEFSEQLLDDEVDEFRAESADVTAALDPASRLVECWTCGSEVPREVVEENLAELRDVIDEHRAERDDVSDRLETYQERARELRDRRDRKRRLESRLDEIESEIDRRERRIDDLQAEAEDVRDRISTVQDRIQEADELRENDLVERYQRLSELEYRHGQLEQEICSVETEIEDLRAAVDERDQLESQRTELASEIEDLRTRIDDLEAEVVSEFNDRVAEVMSLLDYENVERVWIERDVDARTDPASTSAFRLHVVREAPDGTVYEDAVETLSESERDVVGLVVALAGYVAHEVYECVPVLLLDSLEAIDADRISRLVEYVSEFAPYLVVALLTEDARALDDEYPRVSATDLRSTAD